MSAAASGQSWPKIAVVGAGAVGCYFGGMLARAGAPVTLIGRKTHVDAMLRDGLLLERLQGQERIRVAASTEIGATRDAEVIMICVKTVDTETTALALQPHLRPGATVLSFQNGVDNVERMRTAAQLEAIPAVVYVAAAMAGPGHIRHSGRGDLVIGRLPAAVGQDTRATDSSLATTQRLSGLAETFARAEIPCRISEDIRTELWTKMAINCAFNAISALGRARYGQMAQFPEVLEILKAALVETVAIARAEGVPLQDAAMVKAAEALAGAMTQASSSTAQDIERGRPTEIDSLNGYIARRGAQLGVPTPVNRMLHALVKLLEQSTQQIT
jgi:2-dehydropantoate 2-reductase